MFEPLSCPSGQILEALVLGHLPEEEAEALALHLEQCDHCATAAHSLHGEDSLVAAARALAGRDDEPRDAVIDTLIERLTRLPETTLRQADVLELLAPPHEPGELGRLGPYRILRVLGMGGMGVVFEAEDLLLRRRVAVKTLKPSLCANHAARGRFLREAQAAAAVAHDHVVPIHQVGEDRGVPFLAMPLLQGETLEQRLEGARPLVHTEVVRIAGEIAAGLAAAHACGLIHRDIKPANIWLESDTGRVKILDFGLAHAVDEDTFVGTPTMAAGTPAYLAPEVATGRGDARSDLYSLGCVVDRMLAGTTSPRLTELVGRLRAPNPADRLQSARAVLEALRDVTPRRPRPRRLVVAALLTIGALAAILVITVKTKKGQLTLQFETSSAVEPDPFEKWTQQVAPLPAAEQVTAVADKLKERNPGFDGNLGVRYEGDKVVELHLLTDHVTDIAPLRALSGLEMLVCRGSESGKGRLVDLSPLKGMQLHYLDCSCNLRLRDLSPLRGVPLRELVCWCTPVIDLRPLRGMPLTHLDCAWTHVTDLQPLEGMRLTRFFIQSGICSADLAPLVGMPLRELGCEFHPERDTAILRTFATLVKINELPADEFWKRAEARRADLEAFIKHVPTLAVEKQTPAVGAKLREFNPDFDGQVIPTVRDGAVVGLQFFIDNVKDLRPLRALPKLQRLVCPTTQRGKSSLFDLSPLAQLPLTSLECSGCNISDLSPLSGMRLGCLVCSGTPVRDLSPLRGQPLIYLDCRETNVSNLTPLKGMALLHVHLKGSRITDLSPLQGMPIAELTCDFKPERDAAVLRSLKSLEKINDKPAAEFWDEYDGR